MMAHTRSLIGEWVGGTVVLSPRDLENHQLRSLSASVARLKGGQVLLDPQFYLPHADHFRLVKHEFWPKQYESGVFFGGTGQTGLLRRLKMLNDELGTAAFILPSELAKRIDDEWVQVQRSLLRESVEIEGNRPVAQTIALNASTLSDSSAIGCVLDFAEQNTAPWYYIVAEHPNGDYLIDDPIWLANLLDLIAGLKLLGSKVIVGYCNHQLLCAAVAKADSIASGTWMNVRSFPPEKFKEAVDGDIRQRATWYYCPHALSEYKVPSLDVAYRLGVLGQMRPRINVYPQITALFEGVQPSVTGLTEQLAFRHYLSSLRLQVVEAVQGSFDETMDRQRRLLDEAQEVLRVLKERGVSGQNRDFSNCIDASRAALAIFEQDRGLILRRKWATI